MSSDRLRNDGGQLLAQLLDLGLQIRILRIATSKLRARGGEFADQDPDAELCLEARSKRHS
jgi:hypothetical protein